MIENIKTVEELETILQVEGLDAILVGPYDLSSSMGITAQFDHPDFKATIERIQYNAKKQNMPCGLHIVKPEPFRIAQAINDGYRFIAYSIDATFLNTFAIKPDIYS